MKKIIKNKKINKNVYIFSPSTQGALVYAHYGEESDLSWLQNNGINLKGRVVLVKAGKISFAEKVGGLIRTMS